MEGHVGMLLVTMSIYLIGMFLIGLYGRKHTESLGGFLAAGKVGGLVIITSSYMASHFGAGFVVGGAESGVKFGIAGVWFGIAMCMSYIVFGLFLAKRVYRGGYITIPDFLKRRYGDDLTSTGFAVINTIAAVGIIAGQIMAGQRLLAAFGLDPIKGAIIFTCVVIAYSAMSGLWGVLVTDMVQMIIGGCGLILACGVIYATGGFDGLATKLPESYMTFTGTYTTYELLMIMVPTTLYGFISQATYQRVVASKTERVAVLSTFISGLLLIPLAFGPVLMGMYGKTIFPEVASATPGAIFFMVIMEKLPAIIGSFVIVVILAAIMSTADSQLLAIAAHGVYDVYYKLINPKATQKQLGVVSLVVTIGSGLLCLFVALSWSSIVALLSFVYSILVAGCLVPVTVGMFWKRGTSAGAVSSMIVGIAVLFFGKYSAHIPYPQLIAAIPGLVVYVVVSLFTKNKPTADLGAAELDTEERGMLID